MKTLVGQGKTWEGTAKRNHDKLPNAPAKRPLCAAVGKQHKERGGILKAKSRNHRKTPLPVFSRRVKRVSGGEEDVGNPRKALCGEGEKL